MPTDADLVMFSAGGNDGDFGKVVETCFALFIVPLKPVSCR